MNQVTELRKGRLFFFLGRRVVSRSFVSLWICVFSARLANSSGAPFRIGSRSLRSAADWNVTAGANLTVLYCGKKKKKLVLFGPALFPPLQFRENSLFTCHRFFVFESFIHSFRRCKYFFLFRKIIKFFIHFFSSKSEKL